MTNNILGDQNPQSLLNEIRNTRKEMELKLQTIDKTIFQEEKFYLNNTQITGTGNMILGWDKIKIKKFTGVRMKKRIGDRDKVISNSSICNTYIKNKDDEDVDFTDEYIQSKFNDSLENSYSNLDSMSCVSGTSNYSSLVSHQGNLKINTVNKKIGRKKRKLNENNSVCSSNLASNSQIGIDN